MMSRLTLIFTLAFSANVFAREVYYTLRSPKALLMGDAYTTLAEDDYTLFYNPAILARHSGFSLFHFLFLFKQVIQLKIWIDLQI